MIDRQTGGVKATPRIGVPFDATPLDIRRRRDLTHAAKSVFAAIANFARMERSDSTTATNRQLADAVGMTPSGVRRPLDELEDAGLIHRVLAAGGRVREAIRVTYAPAGVVAETTTQARGGLARQRQEGWREDAKRVGAPALTPSCTKREELPKTVGISTSDERTQTEPRPSPAEVAAAIKAMVAGRFAPMMFDEAKPESTSASTTSPATTPTPSTTSMTTPATAQPSTTATRAATSQRTSPARTAAPYNGLDLRRVGVSAVAAAWSTSWGAAPKYTPADIERQLRERRERLARAGGPSPAPIPSAAPSSAGSTQSAGLSGT